MGTCFSQHPIEQNLSFIRPVLHEATVHRIADVPGGISLRHVAQTKLAMPGYVTRPHFGIYFLICSTIASTLSSASPRETCRTTPARSMTTVCGIDPTP